jgi:hypothetical protein
MLYSTESDFDGFRFSVIELTVGAGQRMKKSGFDGVRYRFIRKIDKKALRELASIQRAIRPQQHKQQKSFSVF